MRNVSTIHLSDRSRFCWSRSLQWHRRYEFPPPAPHPDRGRRTEHSRFLLPTGKKFSGWPLTAQNNQRAIHLFFSAQDVQHLRRIRRAVECGSSHQHRRACFAKCCTGRRSDAAVHFNSMSRPLRRIISAACAVFSMVAGMSFSPAKAGINRHDQDHVDIIHHPLEFFQRRCGIERHTGLDAERLNELDGTLKMRRALRVYRQGWMRPPPQSPARNE